MPKPSCKSKKEANWCANSILDQINGDGGKSPELEGKNPAVVALGRLGGLKVGKARAEALKAKKRKKIAKKAAEARWNKK